jgi:hypothetical protein
LTDDREKTTKVTVALAAMMVLTDEERMEVFGHFCIHCGIATGPDGRCYCWNDE